MLKRFVKYSGLIGVTIIVNACMICLVIYPEILSEANPALSRFGVVPETSNIFNISIFASGAISLVFLLNVLAEFGFKRKLLKLLVILVFSGCLSMVGLVPMSVNGITHWYIANTAVIAFIVFMILFSMDLDLHLGEYKRFTNANVRRIVTVYLILELILKMTLFAQVIGGSFVIYWVSRTNFLLLKKSKQTTKLPNHRHSDSFLRK